MALTKFKLVNTEGLKGLFFDGDFIAFDRIDDTRAELLISRTHVLERVPQAGTTTTPKARAPRRKRAGN